MVAQHIRRKIVCGDYKAGEHLPAEEQMRSEYGVSRTAFREAVRILETEDLVGVQRGARGGILVKPIDCRLIGRAAGMVLAAGQVPLADILEMRARVEPAAARLAAERYPGAAAARLRAIIDMCRSDPASALESLEAFHRLLLGYSGNRTLLLTFTALEPIVRRHSASLTARGYRVPLEFEQGRLSELGRLVDLIEGGKAGEAEAHWRGHMMDVLMAFIDQPGNGAARVVEIRM
ncbi:MAG TPA: FCD domain-containing protein [Sphingopyxis sp.]|nr:FCD domain-containing protein [Sphingopyxis sp.]HMP44722.1 FCD domain-containing protein [Sphingopyxis sp.]HMQ17717.1 FCD domain-containing protein [Sphingopyxis sp.]